MDIATAEFFRKEREQCTTRDAKHVMPIKLIPDLEWKFIENISVIESDKGVTIYCIKETEDKNEDTQVTNATETEEPRYKHKESSKIAIEDTVPMEITEETGLTGNTGTSQAILVDPTEDTETDVSEQTVAEQVEVTHTIDITELVTGIPEPALEATSRESKGSTTTPPGSPQRESPKVQNKNGDNTEVDAEQAVKKTHKYPKADNSIINKIFSVFRQAKESLDTIPM